VAVASAGLYVCKSAPHADNQANIPPLSFFTGRMPFLTPNQQHQSTEGINLGKPAPKKQNHSGKTNLDLLEQR